MFWLVQCVSRPCILNIHPLLHLGVQRRCHAGGKLCPSVPELCEDKVTARWLALMSTNLSISKTIKGFYALLLAQGPNQIRVFTSASAFVLEDLMPSPSSRSFIMCSRNVWFMRQHFQCRLFFFFFFTRLQLPAALIHKSPQAFLPKVHLNAVLKEPGRMRGVK